MSGLGWLLLALSVLVTVAINMLFGFGLFAVVVLGRAERRPEGREGAAS